MSQPPPLRFSHIFSQTVHNFKWISYFLLHVPIYARVQIFIQLSPTLMKLCHIEHNYLVHIMCSICPPSAETHAFRRLQKSLIGLLIVGWVSEQCLTSPPTQYRLYGRRFLQVKRPNQQYQSTEGESTKENNTKNSKNTENTHTQNSIQITVTQTNTASPLVYNNMGWLGDSSYRGQVR